MGIDRRGFLKVSGLTVLGIASGKASETFASSDSHGHTSDGTTKRYAMVIDLQLCKEQEGCTDCVKACHHVHNVPEFNNRKDEVKWIWKDSFHHAFHEQEHHYLDKDIVNHPVLLLCNHCDNPPCVQVCPTKATFKRESDGIVMMDWHRCIGCRYCVVACPYGSRSFNWRDPRPHIEEVVDDFPTRTRGVVEKCTFCEERIFEGRPPACVEACKHGAMAFGDLEDPESRVRELLRDRFSIRRKPALGTEPEVYYLV